MKKIDSNEITRYLYSHEFTALCKQILKKIKPIEEKRLKNIKIKNNFLIVVAFLYLIIIILALLTQFDLGFISRDAIALTFFGFFFSSVIIIAVSDVIITKTTYKYKKEVKKLVLPMLFEPLGNVKVISKNDPKYDLSSYIKDLVLFDK